MSKKDKILKMYYDEQLKQNDIANKLNVSQSYISQIIKKDKRYITNKENKHQVSMIKKANYNKEYYKTYKRAKKDDDSYRALQAQLVRDSAELSYKNDNYLSNLAFVKWNRSIYNYDKHSSDLILNKNINISIDVPKRVSNRINPNTRRVIC